MMFPHRPLDGTLGTTASVGAEDLVQPAGSLMGMRASLVYS